MPVHLSVEAHVAVLTLDEPGRKNAMTPELGDALKAHVVGLATNAEVRAVVLRGAEGTFSGGGDLAMLERLRGVSADESRRFMLGFYARYLSVLDLPVPTVAAVEGAAIGAGLCLALACDFVVAQTDAKLALNFVQLGLHPGMGATYFVPRRAGVEAAKRLLMTGQRFSGADAVAMGLAGEACDGPKVLPRALELAGSLTAQAPLAVRGLVQALRVDRPQLDACLAHEATQQATSYRSADLGEGLAAAAQRRPACFTGA